MSEIELATDRGSAVGHATEGRRTGAGLGDRLPLAVWVIATAFVVVEIAVSGRYGFMQDELYFVEAGRHLAFGYVDQPPLSPLLTRVTDLIGVSPTAIRIVPALAGGLVVVAAARMAALFGAGRFGRVLAALTMACAPVLLGASHLANTTPIDLAAWSVVLVCVTTALLRHRPAWWLWAGAAAGVGLENDNLVTLLIVCLAVGLAASSAHRQVLLTRWPWLGAAIAVVIWAPNLIWQATHGWPQLAMASALHQQNTTAADYAGGLPAQLIYLGLLIAPLVIAGFVRLWREPELRFIAIAAGLVVLYVAAWVPGKAYYSSGLAPAVLGAGSAAAERWISRTRWSRLFRTMLVTAPLLGAALIAVQTLPVLPVGDVHSLPLSAQQSAQIGNTVGWPRLVRAIAAQDAALKRAGTPPTSIFTGYYAESGALDVLGGGDHLPPVLSGHNAYWMWGPGQASDQTVLAVDALGQLRPYFASCHRLAVVNPPYQVRNDWTGIAIGVCTGPAASWSKLWPRLRHYG